MIKRKKYSCRYMLHKAILYKLNGKQIFLLCILGLIVLGLIGIYAPANLVGLL